MNRPLLGYVFVAVLLAATAVLAQGSITGTVTDATGRPLPGVTVVARPEEAPATSRRTVTDAAGRYRFEDLDRPARYTLLFALPGFTSVARDVDVSGGTATVDVTLDVGRLERVVPVVPLPLDQPGPRLLPPTPGRACLHDTNETPPEAQRRTEALMAMRLIAQAVATAISASRQVAPLPSWPALASSPAVAALRNGTGIAGELAQKIQWGSNEPLPGWRIKYAATLTDVRFALTDERDPCSFTYASADPLVVPPSYGRMLPLT